MTPDYRAAPQSWRGASSIAKTKGQPVQSAPPYHVDTIVATFAVSSSALGAAIASTIIEPWEPVTIWEVALGGAGGILGGIAYAFARRMASPVTVIASVLLAGGWCALLAPIATHIGAMIYPQWRATLFDAVVTLGVGSLLGACGMTLYEGLLKIFDALAKALPEKVDDVLEWIFGRFKPPKKDD